MFQLTEAQKKFVEMSTTDGVKYVMAYGGARSGKTFIIVYIILLRAIVAGGWHVIFRRYFNGVVTSVFEDTIPTVLSTCFPNVKYKYDKTFYRIVFPHNDAQVWAGGLDDKERLDKILGKEYATAYFNECSEIGYSAFNRVKTRLAKKVDKIKKNMFFVDLNPGKKNWSFYLFCKKLDPITRLPVGNPEQIAAMKMNPSDNVENLAENFIEDYLETLPKADRKRFLLGEWADDNENALWKSNMLDPYRLTLETLRQGGDLDRIVVGVDPAVTGNEKSDSTGVVVAGRRKEPDGKVHYYVLEDATLKASPETWARKVVDVYKKWEANQVVAEINNGGDLVTATIRNVDNSVPIKTVRATKGKILRAEPVAALYEQGLVHHVGEGFDALEEQMTSFTGEPGEKSPDRLDALVWAITAAKSANASVDVSEIKFF